MWTEGTIKTPTSIVRYWVKYFEEGSEFGIDGGRISKLMIRREDETIANYDRGWDLMPKDEEAKIAFQILLSKYN
jgi:hypothetical protein